MEPPFTSPYAVGKKIDLLIHGGITARATILHVYEPFNSACTMNLLFDSDLTYLGIQGKVVLKLFDRRYATTLRRTSGTIPWSPAFETRYARMITDGTPAVVQSHLIKRLKAFDNNPNDPRPRDRVAHENCFQVFCEVAFCGQMRNLFDRELEVYRLLQPLQGSEIPRLIGPVTVIEQQEFPRPTNPQCLETPGLLLRYIEGFPLAEFPRHTPMKLWPAIIEETTRTVQKIMDYGVTPEAISPENIIVEVGVEPELRIKIRFCNFTKYKLRREFADEVEMLTAQLAFMEALSPVFTYTLG
ncbi:uncharacterized protein MYU51_002881 [Penicillium brevicompactum]|uniref:uncharacterized protein n=1 Tax=Penicillium brevicompactum TaxID=5074 RepID=UPI0025420070|nr:uncharacterized protein N7506_011222 [Penicillium brevicompactum]KAJ5322092.1 hypothetical protein N7506_011222 [Penicillium brevicompactum]